MSYFIDRHKHVNHALSDDGKGIRECQMGALHAISSHFTLKDTQAVVVLPTGAGKTAVLMLCPFVLKARRVLVITPSQFVRNQIARDFKALSTLKRTGALPNSLDPPLVIEVKETMTNSVAWDALREAHVVVATPNAVSPGKKGITNPPSDLFDLVLIDEAHHAPAHTWTAIIKAFPAARSVLFTATPFRRDRKEIKGRYIYSYPIQRAFDDGIYGEMEFLPVTCEEGTTGDISLARATAKVFEEDRLARLEHSLMVRAESVPRANELKRIYEAETALRLDVVHSGKSQKVVEKVIQRLREGELDGVICVNMLGEGFDFPKLKIAALHAPHRSLAVTLQFLGRFARVNAPGLGNAKFLAVPEELSGQLTELFNNSSAWGKRIRNIGQARIGRELRTREVIEGFIRSEESPDEVGLEDLSLYSFTVFNHVKVVQVWGEVDLHQFPNIPGFQNGPVLVNEDEGAVAFILREELRPKWATTDGFDTVEYQLVVVYHDTESQLLFICSTLREENFYQQVASIFIRGQFRPLSLSKINRILRSYDSLDLFNVGMRNRAQGTVAESYRQLSGPAVQHAIQPDDGRLYHRGHVFGKGITANGEDTIGISSLSKVWRLSESKIPELLEWCQNLARDIANSAPFRTQSSLDLLDAGTDVEAIPTTVVIAANWHESVYDKPPMVNVIDTDGVISKMPLLDLDLSARLGSDESCIEVNLTDGAHSLPLRFSLMPFPNVDYADPSLPYWTVDNGRTEVPIAQYLNHHQLRFHLADGSLLEGNQLFGVGAETTEPRHPCRTEVVDWPAMNVDIGAEVTVTSADKLSVHAGLERRLAASDADVIVYDHRTGECADFIVLKEHNSEVKVTLYHCKGAGGKPSGERVDDLYEVCGQATKSIQWRIKKQLVKRLKTRIRSGSRFVKGDEQTLIDLLESDPRHQLRTEVVAVQPGVSIGSISSKQVHLLSAANRQIIASGGEGLVLMASE